MSVKLLVSQLHTLFSTVLRSVPFFTVLMVLALEALLRLGDPVDSLGIHSVDLWGLTPRLQITRSSDPDIALIGSSLLQTLSLEKKEAFTFSRLYPPYFQDTLRKLTGQQITCVNLCTGSQVPSESFLITRALCNQPNYPRAIFYGIALRDFMANQYSDERNCDSFRTIAPFVPLEQGVFNLISNQPARMEFALSHFSFWYRDRTDFKNLFTAVTQCLLDYLPLDQPYMRISYDHDYQPSRTGFLWEQWIPRKHLASQFSGHPEFVRNFIYNLHLAAYSQGSTTTRELEDAYFEQLASLCQERGINLIIINMPLSSGIRQLAPAELNHAFSDYLTDVAHKYGATVIDLLNTPDFPSASFSDGVHLNYPGSRQLANTIIEVLKFKYPQILESIKQHAAQRNQDPSSKVSKEAPFTRDILF